jgi:hypothetical protein
MPAGLHVFWAAWLLGCSAAGLLACLPARLIGCVVASQLASLQACLLVEACLLAGGLAAWPLFQTGVLASVLACLTPTCWLCLPLLVNCTMLCWLDGLLAASLFACLPIACCKVALMTGA